MGGKTRKLKEKILDHMLLGSVYDCLMQKTRYREEPLSFYYNIMIGQKHRMIFYKRLKKQYFEKCVKKRAWETEKKEANSNTVWFLWMQGIDQAPELVKKCLASLQKQIKDKEIVILDENNLLDYIQLPNYIMEKYQKGIIKNVFF